jgi:SAM-dependent methyltransferase
MRFRIREIFLTIYFGAFAYKKNSEYQGKKLSKILDPYTWTSKTKTHNLAINLKPFSKILDIGSGGQWAREIFENNGHLYFGCDVKDSISPEKQDFFVEDEKIPMPDHTYDLVFSNSVLEHLRDPELAISEIFRVLKPGGYLYCQTNFLYQEHGHPHDYYRFTLNGLESLLVRHSFLIEESSKIGGRFSLVIDNLASFYANKMSNFLAYFFKNSRVKRVLLLPILFLMTVINNIFGIGIFLVILNMFVLSQLPVYRINKFYLGVFALGKKIK